MAGPLRFFRPPEGTIGALLTAQGLDEAQLDAARDALRRRDDAALPWYVRAASGMGAWTAAALVFSFVALTGLFESAPVLFVAGLGGCVAGTFISRAVGDRSASMADEFRRQLGAVLALAGQGLLTASLGISEVAPTAVALFASGLAGIMVVVHPDPVVRFLSAGGAFSGLLVAAGIGRSPEVGELAILAGFATVVALGRLPRAVAEMLPGGLGDHLGPVRFGVLTVVFAMLGLSLQDNLRTEWQTPVSSLGMVALLAWRMERDLAEAGAAMTRRLVLLPVLALIALIAWRTPGVPAGLLILGIALRERDPVMLLYGVLGLLTFLTGYYYSLDLPLWEKAGVLAAGGALCLVCRALVLKLIPDSTPVFTTDGGADHA